MKKYIVDHVARGYKKSVYQSLYTNFVVPVVPGPEFWKNTRMGVIYPPVEKPMPGRPKKKRYLEKGEVSACGTKLFKRNYKVTCQTCKQKGHNSATCPTKNKASSSNVAAEPVEIEKPVADLDVYQMYKDDYTREEFEKLVAECQPVKDVAEEVAPEVVLEVVLEVVPEVNCTFYASRPPKPSQSKKVFPKLHHNLHQIDSVIFIERMCKILYFVFLVKFFEVLQFM